MSQALQCTQFDALICRRLPPARRPPSRRRGPAEVLAGVANSCAQRVAQMCWSATFEVARLRFLVRVAREEDGADAVARLQAALAPAAVRRRDLVELEQRRVVGVVRERPGRMARRQRLERAVRDAEPHAVLEPGRTLRTL